MTINSLSSFASTVFKADAHFVSHEFTNKMIAWELPIRGIPIILVGIKRLQSSPDHLTALHSDVYQLALAAKMFDPVLPLLNHDIVGVDRANSAVSLRDFLLYFYYGGMIYGALKQWDRALQFFDMFTTPVDVQMPHYVTPKLWKRHCRPYLTLATLFESNGAELPAFVEQNLETFISDENFGLVKQVLKSHVKFQIKNLTKTFMTMSLMDVASRVELTSAEEVEAYLVEMIEAKAIFARIDKQSGTVQFLDDPEKYSSLQMLLKLCEKMNECIRLDKHLTQVTDELVQTPSHVRRTVEMEQWPKAMKSDQY